jgi:rare lipoprotein A (peptidoglycan hydrolase)
MKSVPLHCQRDRENQHDSIDLSAGAASALGIPLDGIGRVHISH